MSARLERAGIAYMLTGSMAMNFYAQPCDAVSSAIENPGMFNLIHHESVIKVDCIVQKNAPYRREKFDGRTRVAIEDFSTWIVTKEDLIISKLDWARDSRSELQLGDVRNLLSTGYDEEYIARWTEELGLTDLWKECRR